MSFFRSLWAVVLGGQLPPPPDDRLATLVEKARMYADAVAAPDAVLKRYRIVAEVIPDAPPFSPVRIPVELRVAARSPESVTVSGWLYGFQGRAASGGMTVIAARLYTPDGRLIEEQQLRQRAVDTQTVNFSFTFRLRFALDAAELYNTERGEP